MRRLEFTLVAAFLIPILIACAQPPAPEASTTVQVVNDAKLGQILVDSKGMSLYGYRKDDPDRSNCLEQCASNWPPLILATGDPIAPEGLSGTLGTTTRADGSRQVTYNKIPLYHWTLDQKPGDTEGLGLNDWFIVTPSSSK